MKPVFISNARFNTSEMDQFVFDKNLPLEQIVSKIEGNGNLVFIIDVHCMFNQSLRMQQQGGVKIFHCLRRIFVGRLNELKVVFYSPIPREYLVRLKPENEILNILPFIEVKCETEQFQRDLNIVMSEYAKGLIAIETLLFNYPGKR